jgi:hypothetical protein
VEAPAAQPVVDRTPADAGRHKLMPGDNSVLARCELGHDQLP